jgi:hypothetical protein
MANPIKAVKAIGRAVGGITGKGSKQVNPIYKNSNLKIPSNAHPKLHSKVSSSVKLVPSAEMKKTNFLFAPTSGAKQAMKENAQSINTSKRGLKAAQGKSLAPRGYKPDTKGRARAKEFAEPLIKSRGRKEAMKDGARALDIERTRLEFSKAPKNKRGK